MSNLALAQQWDSLNIVLTTDTVLQKSIHKADSITGSFQSKADSLHAVYQNQFSRIDQASNRIQAKIDSLNHVKLPTDPSQWSLPFRGLRAL
jgi:flagellar capping protein FliD